MELDDVTALIINAAVRIHRDLGPGLMESVYESVLARALEKRGLPVERQRSFTLSYDGVEYENAFRLDLLVDGRVVVEVKSLERLAPVHGKQLLTYLRVTNLQVGLLLNFGAAVMKDGIKRVVYDLPFSASPQPPRLRVNHQAAEQ